MTAFINFVTRCTSTHFLQTPLHALHRLLGDLRVSISGAT